MAKKTITKPAESELISGPKGFVAGGITAGIKASGSPDLAMILCEMSAASAVVTTTNLFCSAPVLLCRERMQSLSKPFMRGVIVNSGIANACTGEAGYKNACTMVVEAEKSLGVPEHSFFVASTGVIGQHLPMPIIKQAIPQLAASLSATGWEAFERAIMTTDLVPKIERREIKIGKGACAKTAVVLGLAKGSGMIHPNMATMLSFIVTDYPLTQSQAKTMLHKACDGSFNCLTVDGDTSTSDTLILMSSGAVAKRSEVDKTSDALFESALMDVSVGLSKKIARDGEGASKLVTIEVIGSRTDIDARIISKSIANSPLVKTALFGNDPNWGRICCAAGYAGVPFDVMGFSLKLQGKSVMRHGLPVKFDRAVLSELLKHDEVLIQVCVGGGKGRACAWTCDLSYDYIRINADYTT